MAAQRPCCVAASSVVELLVLVACVCPYVGRKPCGNYTPPEVMPALTPETAFARGIRVVALVGQHLAHRFHRVGQFQRSYAVYLLSGPEQRRGAATRLRPRRREAWYSARRNYSPGLRRQRALLTCPLAC